MDRETILKTYDIKEVNGVVYMNGGKSKLSVDEIIEAINTPSLDCGLQRWNKTEKKWETL